MRVPTDTIAAPMFPAALRWLNVASLRMDQQRGRPVLLEFFDVCRPASLRTLPYLQAWHERYEADGLRVISVHAPGFAPGRDEAVVAAAVARLGIAHPVLLDTELQLWRIYENEGWPARYLFDRDLRLFEVHFGEGGYHETEAAIQELLGVERDPVAFLHPEDDPDARIVVPTPDQEGAWSGPYEAGAVWAVLEGTGTLRVNGADREVAWTGAHLLVDHGRHEHGVLEIEAGPGVTVHAVCFTPGLAAG
ncbi:DipZ protein [Baekduia soli]|uniref:DipZ protein n=1 Tax=Baekduia soli TaxID=496014 RepID=A0A5B8UAX6_9ACTN|nr:DipZ protein [Baekduia soli]QEC49968.1 DipZ protein [Baekduia soli]